jgi:hypothetical protein
MSKIIELAKKLKALAEQGVGGEKINAQKMLAALCEKHSIDPALLDEEKRARHYFDATAITDQLLNHIIWKVCGGKQTIYKSKAKKYGAVAEVTDAQRLEILAYYSVYAPALKAALKDLQTAFVIKNRIWSDDEDSEEEPEERKPETPESRAETRRLLALAEGLESTPFHKQLGESKK